MKCKITLGDIMKLEQDKRRFDFHDIGRAIKRAREASGMTQEQLAYIVDRSPRTIMPHSQNSLSVLPGSAGPPPSNGPSPPHFQSPDKIQSNPDFASD